MQGMRKRWFCMLAGVGLLFIYACGGGGDDGTPAPPPPGEPVVETLQATGVSVTGATLRGTVDPNGLDNVVAFFEWSLDSTLAAPAKTPDQPVSGDNAVTVTQPIVLTGDNTVYYRIVASDADGPEVQGEILSSTPANPDPVADAGIDQQVIMGQEVTLDGSGSDDPLGAGLTYLWEQVGGTTVTLSDNGAVSPTFTAPTVSPPGENLLFQLTITDSLSRTSQDNVTVTTIWGALDDFTDNTLASYAEESVDLNGDPAPGSVLNYDLVGERLQVLTGDDLGLILSGDFPAPGNDNGVFSFDFTPIGTYPSGGGIWVRLMEDAANYYELAIFNWDNVLSPGEPSYFAKVLGGVVVDNIPITANNYDNVATRTVTITFAPTSATAAGFLNGPTTVTGDNTAINVQMFEIQANQQDVFYDNIQFTAAP